MSNIFQRLISEKYDTSKIFNLYELNLAENNDYCHINNNYSYCNNNRHHIGKIITKTILNPNNEIINQFIQPLDNCINLSFEIKFKLFDNKCMHIKSIGYYARMPNKNLLYSGIDFGHQISSYNNVITKEINIFRNILLELLIQLDSETYEILKLKEL